MFIASDALKPVPTNYHLCDALVDAAASETSVAKLVAHKLNLQPSGKREVQTAGGLVSALAARLEVRSHQVHKQVQ